MNIWLISHINCATKFGNMYIDLHLHFFLFKVICVIRNPRDVLVSGYFFFANKNLIKNPESLATYFDWFLKGNGEYPVESRS